MQRKITLRSVKALRSDASKIRFLWDDELPGFGVRITPRGVRSYVFQYKVGSRTRRMTIGRHGAPWTPATARAEAKRLRGEVAAGGDPAERKKEARCAETLVEFAEQYLAEHAIPKKKPRSVTEDRNLLRSVILPRLGRRKLAEVTRADVGRLHHSLRKTPYRANRALALLSKMFNLAERWGLRPDASNPCRHVERFKEHRRERFLRPAELKRLGKVLGESESSEPWEAIAAIRLLLFTGCRLGEVLGLRWEDVDVPRGRLVIPDSKTGEKVVALPAPALQVLDALPCIEGSPYVLPARRGSGHFVGVPHVWRRVREQAQLEGVRIHDLRHTFASVGACGGETLLIIGALLGHRQPATTARYAHLDDDPKRAAADRIARSIASAMDPEMTDGEVVEMDRSRARR